MLSSMSLPKNVLDKYHNPIFIETGTGDGHGMVLAKACGFPKMITIDRNPDCLAQAKQLVPECETVQGDSGCLLGDVIDRQPGVTPITFWLDAHTHFAGQPVETTILSELATIIRKPWRTGSVILLDDWNAFGTAMWAWTHTCTKGDLSAALVPYLSRGFSVNWEKNVINNYDIMVVKEGRV